MEKTKISGSPGFSSSLSLEKTELFLIRSLIRSQWLERIKMTSPEHLSEFEKLDIKQYHIAASLLDHNAIWPKTSRILPKIAVKQIRKMNFIKQLEEYFGKFIISNEEGLVDEEIYWRIVRPNELSDIGSLHADAWFWEIGKMKMPLNKIRVKVWIAIEVEKGASGFVYIPNSHLNDWPYEIKDKNGLKKPVIKDLDLSLDPELFMSNPGDSIIFNDKLIHGGQLTLGNFTRVSLEFTMFVDPWV